jgi:hypothetical protein
MTRLLSKTALILTLFSLLIRSTTAQEASPSSAESQFQRGFFLQVHEHDLAGAAAMYEKAASDSAASETLRSQAKARLLQVREDLAAARLAALMPADCMAYAEIVEPGAHIERILKMMGLVDPPSGGEKPSGKPVRLGNGLSLSPDFTISPALVAELKKIRGAAVGLTAVDDKGRPAGLAVIHPGDCDLVRGVIETGVQLLEPGQSIEGFKTYRIPDFGWVMVTARLVFVSDSRDQLAAAVKRLRNPQAANLAASEAFKRAAAKSKGALLFAFADGPQIVKRFGPMLRGQQAAMIRTLLDLEHLESLVVALTTTDNAIQLRAQLNLMSGHHNMLYALVRTAPITKRSLERVPEGAAAVLVVGLNPPGGAAPASEITPPSVSAMDIGREFFHNIEELSVFALPPAGPGTTRQSLPEVGAVIAVKDPAKSEALWNQLLSLATLFGARQPKPPAEIAIEGKTGHVYQFDGLPPIVVVRTDRELVIGTQAAVTASVKVSEGRGSIVQDAAFAPLIARLTPHASKALLVDVGRAVDIAATLTNSREARDLKAIGSLTRDSKLSIVTDEAPNQLTIFAEVTGLPKFGAILSLIGGQQSQRQAAADK